MNNRSPDRRVVNRLAEIGQQYQRGDIRIREAARLLGIDTSDAVFELEQAGFCRDLSDIALTEAERETIYQRLRDRRLSHGAPFASLDLVERDVISSERLEGVDARVWISRR